MVASEARVTKWLRVVEMVEVTKVGDASARRIVSIIAIAEPAVRVVESVTKCERTLVNDWEIVREDARLTRCDIADTRL